MRTHPGSPVGDPRDTADRPPADDPVPRSVGRAFDLLAIVVEAGAINLTTAASRAGLTPTTALRHLRALEALGYVRRGDDGAYAAGPAVLRLAALARDDGPIARLVAAARPVLAELTARTGESAYLALIQGDRAVYLATCESPRSIRHVGWVGKAVPLAGTAVGEALAGEPGVRVRSGAVEPDITAIAVAVGDGPPRTPPVAALSIIGPTHRMDDAAIAVAGDALRDGADRIARLIGPATEAVA
jgi:urocanate hydratase